MADGTAPEPNGGAFSGLLSEEEMQELLAPLDTESMSVQRPMLVLTDHPKDAERIILHLMHHDVPVVPTEDWDDALRLLENRRYAGAVATAGALGSDPAHTVDDLRVFHPDIPVCVIVDPCQEVCPIAATVVVRPELEGGLDEFLKGLVGSSGGTGPAGQDARVPSGVAPQGRLQLMEGHATPRFRAAPAEEPPRPQTARQTPPEDVRADRDVGGETRPAGPDPLVAVQALLEAKAAGEDLVAGLRRWAERDRSILGIAECHLDEAEWRLRATTPVAGERHRMLLLLLDQLEAPDAMPDEPTTAGPFSLFPLYRSNNSCVALWHPDADAGREALLRLRPLLPLIEALPEKGEDDTAATVRERFIALLESRMRATDRGDGQLGMLLVEAPEGESPALLCRDLKSALRGGDWIEVVGSRLYVILEHPGKGTLSAIGARLRGTPASQQLRVVALGWEPSQGRAKDLVRTAEKLLEEGEVVVLGAAADQ